MKTLALILALAIAVSGQELVEADGGTWQYVATGRDKDGAKFNVFARRTDSGPYRELEVKFGNDIVRAEHDCKRKLYRLKGNHVWVKPDASVGAKLVKFACKK